MENENILRKNLKFNISKPEQRIAHAFLSRLDKKQTMFISYLVNEFLEGHGIKEDDIETLKAIDIYMLLEEAEKPTNSKKLNAMKGMNLSDEIQQMIQACIKDMAKKGELPPVSVNNITTETKNSSEYEKRSVTDLDSEDVSADEVIGMDNMEDELEDESRDEDVEVNTELLGLLDSFSI